MKGRIPILDAGHGGLIRGRYQTEGKRSPNWRFGTLYEGAFNRWVVNLLMRELDYAGVPYYHISPELRDVSLKARVNRANAIADIDGETYLLSIHANAGGGTGLEGFTYFGQSDSDEIAEEFLTTLRDEFEPQGWKLRTEIADGDLDKESNFYILRNTKCPAFLLECGFMDFDWDYSNLWSQEYQQALACNLAKTIIKIYESQEDTSVV